LSKYKNKYNLLFSITFENLAKTYIDGLPFLGYECLGKLIFSTILFTAHYFLFMERDNRLNQIHDNNNEEKNIPYYKLTNDNNEEGTTATI
jgi:hypothetical protein